MKHKKMISFMAGMILLVTVLIFWEARNPNYGDIYRNIVRDGYNETAEVWLAAFVGEIVSDESAYTVAQANGYRGTFEEWSKEITGISSTDASVKMYDLACANGFDGSLSQWLDSLVDNPSLLGRSNKKENKTEYEIACEFGYIGSYTQWLVSLVEQNGG